jgi:outer membrane protein assembly factor BamB
MIASAGERVGEPAEDRRRETGRAFLVGGSLAAALVFFYFLSTLTGAGGGQLQGATAGSGSTPGIILPDQMVSAGAPSAWTQARSSASGNAAWGPAVDAPFSRLWELDPGTGREFFSAPAVVGGVLYFGCNDGKLRAVNAASGSVIWSFQTICGICGEPAVDSSGVYFGAQDGTLYALDRDTGARMWSAGVGYHIFCDTGILCDTLVITGNSMGKICALGISDGEPAWSNELGGLVLGPVILDSICVFTTENGKVSAYSASGNCLWTRSFTGQSSAPASDGEAVFAGFSDGTVRRLDLSAGEVDWETDIVASSSRTVLARPVLVDTLLLVGTCDGRLVCLGSGGGRVLWEQSFENWLQLPPASAGHRVYLACDDQRLHVLDLATGAKLDSLEMGGYAGTAPVLADGRLYFGTAAGEFFALAGSPCREDSQNGVSGQGGGT